jgi:hypothetical protein
MSDEPVKADITGLLQEWQQGSREAIDQLMPLVYGALSGMFLARSLRILRTAPSASALSLA